jgi:hypothetical protein
MSEEERRRALDIWSQVINTRERATNLRTGTLGDGAGNVSVSDRPGWSWIRFDASPNKVSIIYNKYQNWAENTYVVVGKQHPDDPYDQVLWVNLAAYGLTIDLATSAYYSVSPHGETHLWGSTDPAWISTGNVVDGRINATDPYSMQVFVEEFLYAHNCAVVRYPGEFIDLTAYIPSGLYGGSVHRYALLYLDKAAGSVGVVSGDTISTDFDPTVPATPENSIPLGVVDISGLTTQITAAEIFPWKMIWNAVCDADVGDHTHSATPGDGGESLIGFEELMTACAESIFIVSGSINPTNFYHEMYLLDDYITGLYGTTDLISITPDPLYGCGQLLLLKPADPGLYASYTITLRHGIGNIWLSGERDIVLDESTDHILLVYNGTWWCELGNTAGGAYTDEDAIEAIGSVTQEPNGFLDRTNSVMTFVDAAPREFTITPTGASFVVRIAGKLYNKTSESITIPDVTGLYYIYYDADGIMTQSTTVWDLQITVPIAMVYWNSSLPGSVVYEERHGLVMDWRTHYYLHTTRGTVTVEGFDISGYTIAPPAPADADNTYAIATGKISDEDIESTLAALADGGPYTVWYRSGAAGVWEWSTGLAVPFDWSAGSYINYNEWTGATWQMTALGNNEYVNYYLIATNAATTGQYYIAIPGQSTYTALGDAVLETIADISFGDFPIIESAPIYKLTYKTGAAYGTTGKCRTELVTRLIGLSSIFIANNTPSVSHAELADRSLANQHPATAIATDVTNFDGLLSATETDVQLALDALDKPDGLWASDGAPQAIYTDASGNVGIREASPDAVFHVTASSVTGLFERSNAAIAAFNHFYNPDDTDNNGVALDFFTDTDGVGATTKQLMARLMVRFDEHDHPTRESTFRFQTSNGGAAADRLLISPNGDIGIGGTPSGRLDVTGNIGGYIFWDAATITAVLQTILPAGSVDMGMWFSFVVTQKTLGSPAGTTISASSLYPNNTVTLFTDGTNICTLACTVGGAVTVQRTAGTADFELAIQIVYD